MAGNLVAWSLPTVRRNKAVLPLRNLAVSRGDDVTIETTIYGRDTDATPLNVGSATLQISVLRMFADRLDDLTRPFHADYDYGFAMITMPYRVVWQGAAQVLDAAGGVMGLSIPSSVTKDWIGRYRLRVDFGFGAARLGAVAIADPSGLGVSTVAHLACIGEGQMLVRPSTYLSVSVQPDLLAGIGLPMPNLLALDGTSLLGSTILADHLNSSGAPCDQQDQPLVYSNTVS